MSLVQGMGTWSYPGLPCPFVHLKMWPGSGDICDHHQDRGVATEDSYCHQGINKGKKKKKEEGGLNNANTATEIKGCELILARLDH